MAHAQKPDFVFRRNEQIHLNRRGHQFNRLLAVKVCTSAIVMVDTPCSEVVRRVLATKSIRQFPLHFPSLASPCVITFQLDSNYSHFAQASSIHWMWILILVTEEELDVCDVRRPPRSRWDLRFSALCVMCGCFGNMYTVLWQVFLNLTDVLLTLTEVFPCISSVVRQMPG
jgi:hypothetical protein